MSDSKGARRRHLVSAYAELARSLRQMEDAAEGRSPTGFGSPLTPLDADSVKPILRALHRLKALVRALVAELAPEELTALESVQSRHNTLVWFANLLDTIRAAVDSIQPSRMNRYGEAPPHETAALAARHEEFCQELRRARSALEQLQQEQCID